MLGSAAGYLSFEILGDPLEHQTHLGMLNWNVFGLPLAGLAQGDRHELAALQPFKPIDAFAQQGCRGGQGGCAGISGDV